jgi:hypothetical protein
MVFETNRIRPIELASSPQNATTLKSIVSAWSDLQLESESISGSNTDSINSPTYSEEELTLTTQEPFSQKDVPEWLVMATAASLENSIDVNDSKVLLQ